jgi:hypothetical protein
LTNGDASSVSEGGMIPMAAPVNAIFSPKTNNRVDRNWQPYYTTLKSK